MKTIIFIIVGTVSVILIIALFFVFQFLGKQNQLNTNPSLTLPTPIENVSVSGKPQTQPVVKYDTSKINQLVERAKTRLSLSESGTKAKNTLLLSMGNKSGTVYSDANVIIQYISSPDLFQTEILNLNITSAKQGAVNWMLSQGFTNTDVCNLPFSFYLSQEVSSQIQNTNTIFSPLPDGC